VKDAICIFGGGCTGEMISPEGLLLTNHHCGFGSIQALSTLENNYVDNGFWSKQRSEELPCPGVTATFITRMEDVTIRAMQGISEGMGERDRQAQIDKNLTELKAKTKKKVKDTLLKMAAELLRLYAVRQSMEGHAFPPPGERFLTTSARRQPASTGSPRSCRSRN
jgi:hypothetical protein